MGASKALRVPPARVVFSPADRREAGRRVAECLRTGQLTLGPWTRAFEERFAAFVGAPHAVAVNSGTSALEICLRIFGVRGRDVLVPTNTFFATVLAVLHAGGRPVFVDVEPTTLAIDPDDARRRVTRRAAGIVAVHIGGVVSPGIERLARFCRGRGLFLLEDAAHAHGSTLRGRAAGTFGQAASFSFYPTKVMTSGEGGMIVTRDARIDEEARLYRDQGKVSFLQNLHSREGYNWRMSELHAAVGELHLRRLARFVAERRRLAHAYDRALRGIPGVRPLAVPSGCASNYYKYVAVLDRGIDRRALKARLRERHGIGLSGEVYEVPCHRQPYFKDAYPPGSFPVAEDLAARHVCLPIYAGMRARDVGYVATALRACLSPLAPNE